MPWDKCRPGARRRRWGPAGISEPPAPDVGGGRRPLRAGGRRMRRVVLRGLRDAAGALGRAVAGDEYAHDVRAGWAPPSKPARRTLPLIVVVLTFTTGVVDAVSYLGLGRVFTGLQSNVVVLGFALAGTEGFSVAPPAVS